MGAAPSPQRRSPLRCSRTLGGGGGVEAAGSGQVWSGSAGLGCPAASSEPRRPRRARPNAPGSGEPTRPPPLGPERGGAGPPLPDLSSAGPGARGARRRRAASRPRRGRGFIFLWRVGVGGRVSGLTGILREACVLLAPLACMGALGRGTPSFARPIQARPCAPRPGSGRDWRPRGSGPAPAAGPLPWGPRSRRAVGRRTRARRRPCADWAAPLLRQRVVFLFFWGEEGGYVFSLNEICQRRQRQEGSPLSVESELCLLHWAVWCCSVPASVWLLRELRKPFAEVNVARLPRPCEHCLRCQQQNSIYR